MMQIFCFGDDIIFKYYMNMNYGFDLDDRYVKDRSIFVSKVFNLLFIFREI